VLAGGFVSVGSFLRRADKAVADTKQSVTTGVVLSVVALIVGVVALIVAVVRR
jgi:hypothetical protein